MIPRHLSITGIGPHEHVELDFPAGLSCLYAPTGTGKSFLTGCVFAAFYGYIPAYPGSIYDHLTLQGDGRAKIVLTFSHHYDDYRIEREFKKTAGGNTSQTVNLYQFECEREGVEPTWLLRAGPNQKKAEPAIVELIGGDLLALATWFASGELEGDLCLQDPAERKTLIGDMAGHAHIQKWSEGYGDAARGLEGQVKVLEAQIAGREGISDQLVDAQTERTATERTLKDEMIPAEKNAREMFIAADLALAAAKDAAKPLARAKENLSAAEKILEDRSNQMNLEKTRMIATENIVAKLPALREAVAEAEATEARIEKLERQEAAWRVYEKWERQHDKIVDAIDGKEKVLAAQKESTGVSAEDAELAKGYEQLVAEYAAAKAESDKIARADLATRAIQHDLEATIRHDEGSLLLAKQRAAKTPKVPGPPEACSVCPLMKEWGLLGEGIEHTEKRIEANKAKLAALPDETPLPDLSDLIKRGQRAKTAKESLAAATLAAEAIAKTEAEITALKIQMVNLAVEKPDKAQYPGEELTKLRIRMKSMIGTAQSLATAEEEEAKLPTLTEAHKATATEVYRAATVVEAATEEVERLEAALTGDLDVLQSNRDDAESAQAKMQYCVEGAKATIATLTERISNLERQQAEIAEKATSAAALAARAMNYRTLEQAFGKKGVQPILIEQYLPALEGLGDQYLDMMTGGRMRLRYCTQSMTKGGDVRETLSIMVADGRGERDCRSYSGGEKQIIRTANRIAACLWQAELTGQPAECLFLDEAGNNLSDNELSDYYVNALKEAAPHFGLLVAVTPKSDIARRFEKVIELK